MKALLAVLSLLAALGCAAPSAAPPPTGAPTPSLAPFEAPLDPATLRCSAVAENPAAARFATQWIAGHLRARIMQGVSTGPVDEVVLMQTLQDFCQRPANKDRTIDEALVAMT